MSEKKGQARAKSVTRGYHKPLEPFFGPLLPEQITPELVAQYIVERNAVGVSGRHELVELKATLNAAERRKAITKAPHIDLPAAGRPRERFLTRGEFHRLLECAEYSHTRLFILIAGTTGARKGAVLDLTWDRVKLGEQGTGWIDFDNPDRPETHKRRTIVRITGVLVRELQKAKKQAQSNHVIECYGEPLNDIRTSFMNAAAKAGLGPEVTPHVLKHSVISWLAQEGVSIDRISYMTATSPKMIERVYRKYNPDHFAEEAAILANGLDYIESVDSKRLAHTRRPNKRKPPVSRGFSMVEPSGIEPLTSTLPV